MGDDVNARIGATVDAIYRTESRRVLATLIRLLGDFDLAEEAMQDAFKAAVEQWPRDDIPDNPVPWLVSAGRFKAITGYAGARGSMHRSRPTTSLGRTRRSRRARRDRSSRRSPASDFTCCHPALPPTHRWRLRCAKCAASRPRRFARRLLTPAPTLAQRIVRAKNKIRDARIPMRCRRAATCLRGWKACCV